MDTPFNDPGVTCYFLLPSLQQSIWSVVSSNIRVQLPFHVCIHARYVMTVYKPLFKHRYVYLVLVLDEIQKGEGHEMRTNSIKGYFTTSS
jgi:hypothetical protein